ncbi:uncharacterized protein LOC113306564 [Papaver somniferum]|uniref:uncharacterized protein LOC113306564 n=1 Tax=Papaver somniferum TaxID=3469 RepID=UPI000E6FA671|nr:uncharacterized protein LOC113306564 [Papaver somniferum]
MDLCSLHVNSGHFSPNIYSLFQRNNTEKPLSCKFGRILRIEDENIVEIRVSKLNLSSANRSLVVRAMGKKNHDNSSSSGSSDKPVPEGDDSKGSNSMPESNKSDDPTTHKSHHRKISDWRDFRANLVAREQAQLVDVDAHVDGFTQKSSKLLGPKWAHPIPVPETGCVLVATEKLDGVPTFERTVVLLLRSGSNDPREGPFGVVLNRPLHKKIKHMKPTNLDLATTFSDCSLHFGGPLEASMFLLKAEENLHLPEFEQVVPGLCFGARNSLEVGADLVKKGVLRPQDFRFFVGYAGWQSDQLREEIESDYWFVAACSANMICKKSNYPSSPDLWEEILQLMGGRYSELSKKPKQEG